jgi:hypothetical protein
MRVSSVVAYWTYTHVVMGWNPSQVICFCFMQPPCCFLHYTKNYFSRVVYFSKKLKPYINVCPY